MNGYQLLCELTAIKKRKLSDEARKKLQDAGIIKPEAEYLKGIERGSRNIIKKHKVKIHDDLEGQIMAMAGGGARGGLDAKGKAHMYLDPDSDLFKNARDSAQVKRHELDEIAIGSKIRKKYGKTGITQVRKKDKLVGQHYSPRGIKREYERHKQLQNLYGKDKKSMVPVMRRETGEYRSIKNMPIRQIRKLEKQSINIDPAKYRKTSVAGAQWQTSTKALKSAANKKPLAAKAVKSASKKLTPKNAAHLKKFVKSLPK